MKDRLENGDEIYDSRSERHVRNKASASTLRTVSTFLKDQGIEATADNPKLQELRDLLEESGKAFANADIHDDMLH